MSDSVSITVDGTAVRVERGITVAAALLSLGKSRLRQSPTGEFRGPLCGMGICMECRVTINGRAHCRSCLELCQPGMEVRTDA